jgi:carboxylesterase
VPRPLPPSSRDAFVLPGERAQALLLHGYTGTPYEVRIVGEALAERGVGCRAPLLPGHGTVSRELS